MRRSIGVTSASRLILAAALVTVTVGAASVAAAPTVPSPGGGAAPSAVARIAPAALDSGPSMAPAILSPADVVRETGSWFAHGYTLDLRQNGTGTFAVWFGANDGNRVQLRLIPAPGEATVAEVVAIETVGGGAMSPDEVPGIGGLVTVAIGQQIRTAHVEWSSGPRRLSVDLCPTEGLNAQDMATLRCGA
ncbi:hypothetical protein [Dietzia sp. ANT_WB102]|uniref:hypothetical protein n=1 Tax=Dietzia sp. ANT_WB102 TaxID=2597345 RepID=UPI0011F0969E|nr:hypothetical protein [Dietzia sp. ANT_WB102]KAA0917109.1 hypothetical protein FQ137_12870 [Dietzia sp. ANT_WB102]